MVHLRGYVIVNQCLSGWGDWESGVRSSMCFLAQNILYYTCVHQLIPSGGCLLCCRTLRLATRHSHLPELHFGWLLAIYWTTDYLVLTRNQVFNQRTVSYLGSNHSHTSIISSRYKLLEGFNLHWVLANGHRLPILKILRWIRRSASGTNCLHYLLQCLQTVLIRTVEGPNRHTWWRKAPPRRKGYKMLKSCMLCCSDSNVIPSEEIRCCQNTMHWLNVREDVLDSVTILLVASIGDQPSNSSYPQRFDHLRHRPSSTNHSCASTCSDCRPVSFNCVAWGMGQ